MKFLVALALVGLACSALAVPSKVANQIFKEIEEKGSTNVRIIFKEANPAAARARFASLGLQSRNAKLNGLYNVLKDHADTVQAEVLSFLETQRTRNSAIDVRQMWMDTQIIVRDIDRETVDKLATFDSVASVEGERFFPLEPVEREELPEGAITPQAQWGVDTVHAEAVWNSGNRGEGIVVANIDTGVRYTHVALRSNFRGTLQGGDNNYAWFAPTGKGASPTDNNGHGTHTMGTIAGTANGIGVAPGATWIACKGCATSSCSDFDLTECGNWAGCPTDTSGNNRDCSKAPKLVSNSWGGGQGDSWYDNIIAAWRLVEIAPLFSIGNSGPNCRTANSPGDREGAIGVGSTTSGEQVSSFSSVGPTTDGRMKPDIAAPGSSVVSASSSSDTGYATMSGTSMACPHAAGVSALLYKQNPNLSVDELVVKLRGGAQKHADQGKVCNSVPDNQYPNHHVGQGRIDALASINA